MRLSRWVVEADIRGFFGNISHEWMLRMLEERVADSAFLKLISKWLKAGVLEEDGKVIHPSTGTPQGGVISPILANIYLHYVLDLWFEKIVRKRCRGKIMMMRFADDYVCAFCCKQDAERFMNGCYPVAIATPTTESSGHCLRVSNRGSMAC